MRKLRLLVISIVIAAPSIFIAAPAQACYGEICDGINQICNAIPKHGRDCVK